MDKRTLYGGGAASAVVLAVCVGSWISSQNRVSPLDTPLPPGAVQFNAGDKSGASPAPLPRVAPEPTTAEPLPLTSPVAPASPVATVAPTELVIFVSGAVKKPGVYHLKPGARIESAIFAAGGFKANAQTDALNLADFVQDGDQLNVLSSHVSAPAASAPPAAAPPPATIIARATSAEHPTVAPPKHGRVLGKPAPPAPTAAIAASAGDDAAGTSATSTEHTPSHHRAASNKFKNPGDGVVNLNTASAEDLSRLPGVGAATAQHILDYRQQIGQFSDASQIQAVKGIGPKKYAKMQPFLSVK